MSDRLKSFHILCNCSNVICELDIDLPPFQFWHSHQDLLKKRAYKRCSCWSQIYPAFANSGEANWSGSALFVIFNMNLYQQLESSNLIGWKLEVGVAS